MLRFVLNVLLNILKQNFYSPFSFSWQNLLIFAQLKKCILHLSKSLILNFIYSQVRGGNHQTPLHTILSKYFSQNMILLLFLTFCDMLHFHNIYCELSLFLKTANYLLKLNFVNIYILSNKITLSSTTPKWSLEPLTNVALSQSKPAISL